MDEVTTTIDWVDHRNVVVIERDGTEILAIDLDDWLKLEAVRYAAKLAVERLAEQGALHNRSPPKPISQPPPTMCQMLVSSKNSPATNSHRPLATMATAITNRKNLGGP
jgi:hypothetical protein